MSAIPNNTDTPELLRLKRRCLVGSFSVSLTSPGVVLDYPPSLLASLASNYLQTPRTEYDVVAKDRLRQSLRREGFYDTSRPLVLAILPPDDPTAEHNLCSRLSQHSHDDFAPITFGSECRVVVVAGRLRWTLLLEALGKEVEEDEESLQDVYCEVYRSDLFSHGTLFNALTLDDNTLSSAPAVAVPRTFQRSLASHLHDREVGLKRKIDAGSLATLVTGLCASRATALIVYEASSTSKTWPLFLSNLTDNRLKPILRSETLSLDTISIFWLASASTARFYKHLEDQRQFLPAAFRLTFTAPASGLTLNPLFAQLVQVEPLDAAADLATQFRAQASATGAFQSVKGFRDNFGRESRARAKGNSLYDKDGGEDFSGKASELKRDISALLETMEAAGTWEGLSPLADGAAEMVTWEDLFKGGTQLWAELGQLDTIVVRPLIAALSLLLDLANSATPQRIEHLLLASVDRAAAQSYLDAQRVHMKPGSWVVSLAQAQAVRNVLSFLLRNRHTLILESGTAQAFTSLSPLLENPDADLLPIDFTSPPSSIYMVGFTRIADGFTVAPLVAGASPFWLASSAWAHPAHLRLLSLLASFPSLSGSTTSNPFTTLLNALNARPATMALVKDLAGEVGPLATKGVSLPDIAKHLSAQRAPEEDQPLATPTPSSTLQVMRVEIDAPDLLQLQFMDLLGLDRRTRSSSVLPTSSASSPPPYSLTQLAPRTLIKTRIVEDDEESLLTSLSDLEDDGGAAGAPRLSSPTSRLAHDFAAAKLRRPRDEDGTDELDALEKEQDLDDGGDEGRQPEGDQGEKQEQRGEDDGADGADAEGMDEETQQQGADDSATTRDGATPPPAVAPEGGPSPPETPKRGETGEQGASVSPSDSEAERRFAFAKGKVDSARERARKRAASQPAGLHAQKKVALTPLETIHPNLLFAASSSIAAVNILAPVLLQLLFHLYTAEDDDDEVLDFAPFADRTLPSSPSIEAFHQALEDLVAEPVPFWGSIEAVKSFVATSRLLPAAQLLSLLPPKPLPVTPRLSLLTTTLLAYLAHIAGSPEAVHRTTSEEQWRDDLKLLKAELERAGYNVVLSQQESVVTGEMDSLGLGQDSVRVRKPVKKRAPSRKGKEKVVELDDGHDGEDDDAYQPPDGDAAAGRSPTRRSMRKKRGQGGKR